MTPAQWNLAFLFLMSRTRLIHVLQREPGQRLRIHQKQVVLVLRKFCDLFLNDDSVFMIWHFLYQRFPRWSWDGKGTEIICKVDRWSKGSEERKEEGELCSEESRNELPDSIYAGWFRRWNWCSSIRCMAYITNNIFIASSMSLKWSQRFVSDNLSIPAGLSQLAPNHENKGDLIHRIVSSRQVPNMLYTDHCNADPSSTVVPASGAYHIKLKKH